MDVVEVLAGIVEEAGILAVGFLDDLLQRLVLHARFGGKLVAVVDISLVVLVVVIFQGFLRHVGLQSLIVVRQVRQFESHRVISLVGLVIGKCRW